MSFATRNGVPLLPIRENESPVTCEMVRQLDQESELEAFAEEMRLLSLCAHTTVDGDKQTEGM